MPTAQVARVPELRAVGFAQGPVAAVPLPALRPLCRR